MRVPVPGWWVKSISMKESKPAYILSLCSVVSIGAKRGEDGSEDTHLSVVVNTN